MASPKDSDRVTIYRLVERGNDSSPIYIGATVEHPRVRLGRHYASAGSGRDGPALDWIRDSLARDVEIVIEVVCVVEPCGGWKQAERKAIADARSSGQRLLNVSPGGGSHSEETRAKIAKAHLGMRHSKEIVARIAEKNRGKKHGPHSPERIEKIAAAQRGIPRGPRIPHTPEAKQKMAKARRAWWSKQLPPETKPKEPDRRCRPRPEETRVKISAALKGKKYAPRTPEHRAKLSANKRARDALRKVNK